MTSAPLRQWYPDDLIDEVLPAGRESAEAWFQIPPGFTYDDLDGEERWCLDHFKSGDVVKFKWCEERGSVRLRIRRDGSLYTPLLCPDTPDMFGQPEPAPPEEPGLSPPANHWWNDEYECFAETPEEFASMMADTVEFDDEGFAEVEAETYYWSDAIIYRVGEGSPDKGFAIRPAMLLDQVEPDTQSGDSARTDQ